MKQINRMKTLALSATLVAGLAVPFASAQVNSEPSQTREGWHHKRHGRDHKMGRGHKMGFGKLNLTEAQKTQMQQLRQSHQEQIKPLRDELRAKMQQLWQVNQGGAFNEALVAQKLAEAAPLRAKLMAAQFKLRQDMMSVLTPEQKTQLEQWREQFKAKREQRKANRTGNQGQAQ
jgi:periplasmic protein CpxP/Spy